ncbi:MAG: ABC transporter ATP-binding protein [Actinobacteria bacterium]|nr:ABC transporter ATP-binding protein [Actinomycetota bacterium]
MQVAALRKSYGDVEAVRGVDLAVAHGEVFALLGPNGAGKTTTVEILEGHRQRSSGDVSVLGHDPARGERSYKEKIGIVLQETGVAPYLTVAEAVELYRGYYPSPRPLDEVLEVVGLAEQRDVRVNRLSGGQHRRLDVAIGLAGDPELLFLDEPTTGFDPSARRNAWHMIKNLAALGKTVFLTTHYMDEAESLADRVAVIVAGQIVAEGPPATLAARDKGVTTIRFHLPAGPEALPQALAADVVVEDGTVEIRTTTPTATLHELSGWALSEGAELEGLTVSQPSLEDVYLDLTGAAPAGDPAAETA